VSTRPFVAALCSGVTAGLLGVGSAVRAPRQCDDPWCSNALGLVALAAAWLCRAKVVPLAALAQHLDLVLALAAGSLAGAWWRAPARRGGRVTLLALAAPIVVTLVLFAVPAVPVHAWGVLAGAAIGLAMGGSVGAGVLLVPVMVLLYGLDMALAGSLALMVSVPLVVTNLLRDSASLALLRQERDRLAPLAGAAALGAVLGAALGTLLLSLLLALLPRTLATTLLAVALVYTALMHGGAFFTTFLRTER